MKELSDPDPMIPEISADVTEADVETLSDPRSSRDFWSMASDTAQVVLSVKMQVPQRSESHFLHSAIPVNVTC